MNVKVSFAEDRISDIGDGELQDEGLKDCGLGPEDRSRRAGQMTVVGDSRARTRTWSKNSSGQD